MGARKFPRVLLMLTPVCVTNKSNKNFRHICLQTQISFQSYHHPGYHCRGRRPGHDGHPKGAHCAPPWHQGLPKPQQSPTDIHPSSHTKRHRPKPRHIATNTKLKTKKVDCCVVGGASAKDQAEHQFRGRRYICLTLLLSFAFQENLITSFHLSTKEGPQPALSSGPNEILSHPTNY